MNIKRILLIGLILVAAAASLSIASADSSVKVGEFNFNIPDGYVENETVAMDQVSGSYPTHDGEIPCSIYFKGFEKGTDIILVQVLEFDSPDDAKKAYAYDKDVVNGTTKTIKGHEGLYINENGVYGFGYCQDKYIVSINANDESLLEGIIPK